MHSSARMWKTGPIDSQEEFDHLVSMIYLELALMPKQAVGRALAFLGLAGMDQTATGRAMLDRVLMEEFERCGPQRFASQNRAKPLQAEHGFPPESNRN